MFAPYPPCPGHFHRLTRPFKSVNYVNRLSLECRILDFRNNGEADFGRPSRYMKVSVQKRGMWPPVCLVNRKHHINRCPVLVGINKGIMKGNIYL